MQGLEGESVGVYVGISNFEYGARLLWPVEPVDITQHAGIGGMLCAAAGRLSYTFGFTGPSMSVDTACSSSLVTTHLACQAIRTGECDVAISAGVNLFFGPQTHINFSQARMLSPDGRCKTFDSRADGYGRGEGCGVVLLKRLSQAVEDGNQVLGVIRGSAVNQDGPSGGITVPNGLAQSRVIQQALDNAGLQPAQIDCIEAHGTGTPLGDPIEIAALARIFKERSTQLFVGSVKTNLGHLESAAGIAGLIKAVLMASKRGIPPSCHFESPSTKIDWEAAPMISVPTAYESWAGPEFHAGVSSFSFCGTNAHVIVSSCSSMETLGSAMTTDKPAPIALLSAKSPQALKALSESVASALDSAQPADKAKMLATLAAGRSHLRYRKFAYLEDGQSFKSALALSDDATRVTDNIFRNKNFLFTGQGAHYPEMGVHLYDLYSEFRTTMDELDEIVKSVAGWSVLKVTPPVPE